MTETSGAQNIPEFVAVVFIDEVQGGYYDSDTRRPEPKTEWMKEIIKEHPQHLGWYTARSLDFHNSFKDYLKSLRQRFNQTGGMHLFYLLLLN